jgi:DNA-directed RNA polymerase subunit M
VRFCPECQTRLKPSGDHVVCPKCGFKAKKGASDGKSVTEVKQVTGRNASLKVMDDDKQQDLPTITIQCPTCDNNTAVWWMLQTRSADEATTQFFRCTKCNHTWRNYS